MGVNPDEVVAIGAAIQAGILQGDVKDILLVDVIPLSLSIETMGGVATKLIERNTAIPTSKTQVFSTAADNQTSVEIHVTQGERSMAADNKMLGKFDLVGIPPSPRGIPQIEVTFDIDANGIVNVSAKDLGTGKQQKITITASSNLSKDDIERMRKEAEMHADEDKKKQEEIELVNHADSLVYTSDRLLKEYEGKVSAEKIETIKKGIAELRDLLERKDVQNIQAKLDEVNKLVQEASVELYQKAGAEQQEKPHEKENVVDAEVVDEEKK